MSKAIERIKAKAEKLSSIRKAIDAIKEEQRVKLEALEAEKETISNELISEFGKEGLTSIKTDDGDSYTKATRKGVEITLEAQALKWSIDNLAVSIDRRLVAQKLKPLMDAGEKLPAGFKESVVEYISVRKPAKKVTAAKADDFAAE